MTGIVQKADIVERLREGSADIRDDELMREAAAEIERLRWYKVLVQQIAEAIGGLKGKAT